MNRSHARSQTSLHHPEVRELDLSTVLDALSDPTRRRILLALVDGGEVSCSDFLELAGKTALAYHFARLREAGITRTRVAGTRRLISLRSGDLEARFPGVLGAVLAATEAPKPGRGSR